MLAINTFWAVVRSDLLDLSDRSDTYTTSDDILDLIISGLELLLGGLSTRISKRLELLEVSTELLLDLWVVVENAGAKLVQIWGKSA